MSWIKQNYEKAALGGAILVGAGVAAAVVSGASEVEELAYTPATSGSNNVEIVQSVASSAALEASAREYSVANKKQDDRDIWLFTGIDLHVNEASPEATQDLRTSQPVHADIPNIWWLENGIDIGFSDSPQQDHDGDGFSNMEEYIAQTNPADEADYPEPLVKLNVQGMEVSEWHLKWSEFGIDVLQWSLDKEPGNRAVRPVRANVKAGERLFEDMFEYVGLEEQQGQNGLSKKLAVLKDFRPGRNREIIKVGKRDENRKPGRLIENYKVSLVLDALSEQSSPFTLGLKETFSLPFNAEETSKPYMLESIEKISGGYNLTVIKVGSEEKRELKWTVN